MPAVWTLAYRRTPLRGWQSYALAVATILASIAMTRLTWPFFAGTPFVPLFLTVVVTTHWGNGRAGLVAVFLAAIASGFAFPTTSGPAWDLRALMVFIGVGVLANRVMSSRDRFEAALRANEAELRTTWEHSAFPAALLNRSGRIERVNPALERLLGCAPAACLGMSLTAFNHPDDAAAERERFARLIDGYEPFYQREQRYQRPDGTLLWGRVTVSVIRGAHGVATGALAVLEDITARRQAELDLQESEAKLRRAQKMEAVGQLAAGVAHNFNNLLTVIGGCTDLLLERRRGDAGDRSDLEEIRNASQRGAALTHQLLAVGRSYDAMQAPVDLGRAVTGLEEMLRRVIREDIELTTTVTSAPAVIMIDPSDLDQVILNLVINARDALPGPGAIDVEVAHESIDAPPAQYVRLRVRDNGTGMTADVQAHLFEPFFTTKDVGEGTGLGLAFVHGIVRHAAGFITVDTAPGRGTTVSVFFPQARGVMAQPAPAQARTVSTSDDTRGAVVLLVEDEESVRMATARMLRHAGYRVLVAATPREALEVFDEHASEVDLLLTDVVMPQMHGPELAQRMVARRPELAVLFVSGYSDTLSARTPTEGNVAFLSKPFPHAVLITTVAELLRARAI